MITLTITKLRDRIYKFNENGPDMNVDAFLVIGKNKGILIDGLMDAKGVLKEARKLTDLPLEMIITHGHPDHAGNGAKEFIDAGCTVSIMKEDLGLLPDFQLDYPENAFHFIKDGDSFDLGEISLQVMALAGHTPGSCVLYCPEKNLMFSSDSFGSGDIWLWMPHSLPLSVFRQNLIPVLEFLRNHPDLIIYPGHTYQIPDYRGDSNACIDLAYVEDLMEITEDLIAGRKSGQPVPPPFPSIESTDVCITSGKIMYQYTYSSRKI